MLDRLKQQSCTVVGVLLALTAGSEPDTALRDRLDPGRVFANDYLDTVLGP